MPMDLRSLGWNESREGELCERFAGSVAGRVLSVSTGTYRLQTAAREAEARLSGALRHATRNAVELPSVGDWVAAQEVNDPVAPFRIVGVLTRTSAIRRKQAGDRGRRGKRSEEQLLAANVDVACIVFSLEGERTCNPRAAERYTTMIWASGAQPILLLNKSDIALDIERSVAEIRLAAPGVEVLTLSCSTGRGIEEVRARLPAGATAVLLGPSGVGKSTLVNLLLGEERFAVGKIRSSDLEGRHTTTRRELVVLPGGSLLIDTPGLRELQLWAEGSDLDEAFSDISALAERCRFRDCSHGDEPGCAVQSALTDGTLPRARFASYLDLQRELAYLDRRVDDRLRHEEKERRKKISRLARGFSKGKR